MKFKIGDKVIHRNHGIGIVVANYGNESSVLVKFEKEVKSWGYELEVSTALLKPYKKVKLHS